MNIVRMNEAWVPAVASLEQFCFSEPWSEEALVEVCAKPEFCYLVATEDGNLLGYGGMYVAADEASITNIAVEPLARGRGVATAIIEALLLEARRRGAETAFLEVRAGNEKAIRVYERCGFACVGVRKNFYSKPTEDALIYVYDLTE